MKKISAILITLLFAAVSLSAQDHAQGITVTEPVIEKTGDEVTVSFRAEVGRKVAKRNYSVVFAPVITDDVYVWALPAIVVEGGGAKISRDRGELGQYRNGLFDDAVTTRNSRTVDYTASVPYQLWMEGGRLVMESIAIGCCSTSAVVSETMADNLLLQPRKFAEPEAAPVIVVEAPAEEPKIPCEPQTIAEKMSEIYSFVLPGSEFKPVAPGMLSDEDRDNCITVYFPVGVSSVKAEYGSNSQALLDLMTALRSIENSSDSRVSAILLAGFASPEGSFQMNDRLAWDRAVALKKYIMSHSHVADEQIHLYNGSADWRGLRMLVEASDMPYKQEVIDIIDNTPIWDPARQVGRLGRLMNLAQGQPYRYMHKYFFPQLRNAAYVKVYYENR